VRWANVNTLANYVSQLKSQLEMSKNQWRLLDTIQVWKALPARWLSVDGNGVILAASS